MQNDVVLTSAKRLSKRFPFFLSMLNPLQQRSTKSWNFWLGLLPPLMTYTMSGERTNGERSRLHKRRKIMKL